MLMPLVLEACLRRNTIPTTATLVGALPTWQLAVVSHLPVARDTMSSLQCRIYLDR